MSKKIGMLLDGEFPPDIRVENEMRTLAANGYDVHLLCYDFSKVKPAVEIFDTNITIHRIKVSKKFHSKFNAIALSIPIYFYFWKKQAANFIREQKIDVVHVHDLRLARIGQFIKKKFKIPYVLDLHENYPAALKVYSFSSSFPGNMLISIKQWEKYEQTQANISDAVIAVVEEMQGRIESNISLNEKIYVVPNYINMDTFDVDKAKINITKNKDEIFLLYSGGFDAHRALDTLVKAMKYIQDDKFNIILHLVGSGRTEPELKKLASDLKLNNVIFHGWQNEKAIPSFIELSDIGIVPHLKNDQTDYTIPHKLFQYSYKHKPLIVSDCKPLKRLVTEMNSGLIFRSGNELELSQKIIELASNQILREKLAKNGHDSIINKYNWDTSAVQLVSLYNNLLKN